MAVLLIICSCWFTSGAATINSTASGGNWNSSGSWIGGVIPGPGDVVIIVSTATITVTADAAAVSLDVNGTVVVDDGITLAIGGNVTVESGASLYLSGNTSCTGSYQSVLTVLGNYTNYGNSCFWKSWVIISGDLYSPSASGIQSNGYLVIGGDAIGVINQTGGNSVYPINPNATVSLTGTTPITTAPTSPQTLVDLINSIIFGNASCGFTITGPSNSTVCSGSSASFVISSTTAVSPVYSWEEERGSGWSVLSNEGVYSGVTSSSLVISNTSGMNGYGYRCKVTNASSCSKYSYSATLTVTPLNTITLTSGTGTSNQTRCINSAINDVTYSTTGATGATITGLPSGVTAAWNSNTVTITGTPVVSGSFNYTVNLTGGCGTITATGSIFVTSLNTITLTSGAGTNIQTRCINTPITNITYLTTGATGVIVTGLPAGVTSIWASNTLTISGTPTTTGTFNYLATLTGGCGTATSTGTITVSPANTISLTSGAGSNIQTRCINSAITNITYSTTGATGAVVTGLPAGVTGNWAANNITISGTPTLSGNFNYTVNLVGGCGTVTASGSITVTPSNTIVLTSGAGSNNQLDCINSTITNITYLTSGASGATISGLPAGVTGNLAANLVTISGTPSVAGTFNYTVTLTGGCGVVSAAGTITVMPLNIIALSSGAGTNNQTKCINTPITNITYSTTGATGASFTGLPSGVTGSWAANVVTISGTPAVSGNFNYTVTLTGGCGIVSTTGSIAVTPDNTIVLSSASGTNNQTKCVNTPITNITYTTNGATGATVTGLPAGVNGTWAANIVTISGSPSVPGTYNYSVTLSGGCGIASAGGTITVLPVNTISLTSSPGTSNQTICIGQPLVNISYATTGATGASVSGLPSGVTGNWAANTFTISGIPTASGTFNYTITLTGGCGTITTSGTITVNPTNAIVITSGAATRNQTRCINSAISNITFSTNGATGAIITGLPAGITGTWALNNVTISGSPSTIGIYNYVVTLTGGCGTVSSGGTITVTPDNTIVLTSAAGSDNQTRCLNNPIANITYSTTGSTGASVTGLPLGVIGSWSGNVVTISGIPAVSGVFNYTVNLTGGCGTVSAQGTITVTPNNTITLTSGLGTLNQTKCVNNPITSIIYSTTGATGATFSGLPAGITGNFSSNTVTISGTPSSTGTFNYNVALSGGCGVITSGGTITVIPNNTIGLTSAAGTDNQTVCVNSMITDIVYSSEGATGAIFSGLPSGISGDWVNYSVTISGTPVVSGSFSYTITLTGGCGVVTANGSITVNQQKPVSVTVSADSNPVCSGSNVTLSATAVNGGLNPSYQWKINNINAGVNSSTYSYIPSNSDIVTVVLQSGETCISGNPATSVPLSIKVNNLPSAPSVGTITQPNCSITSGSVVLGNLPSGAWTISPGNISGNSSGTTITGLTPGSYSFNVTNSNGCISPGSVNVLINPQATDLSGSVSAKTDISCFGGQTGSLTVTGAGGQSPYKYKLGSGSYQNTGTFSALSAGSYIITVQDANMCTYDIQAAVSEPDPIRITYDATEASCPTNADGSVTLNIVGGKPPYSVIWSDGVEAGSRTGILPGNYNVEISDLNGCTASQDISVGLSNNGKCLEIQEILTPNNDGHYDTWKIRNIEMYPDAEVHVFNRWGKEVFSTKNISANEWDGTFNGSPLPTDSYQFVLYPDKNSKPITGTITIIR